MTTSPVPSDTDRPAEPRNYLAAMQAEYDAKPLTERLLDYFDESDTECLPPVILDALAKLADAEQARDEAIRVAGANAVAYDNAREEVVSLQARLTAAEADLAALEPIAAPRRRSSADRERYRKHAAWQSAEHYLKQAEAAARKWQAEANWLRDLRDTRKAESEAGTWPPCEGCDEHPARVLPLGHDFLPVNGHPDDDECTHRADGTDDTYCGEPKAAHAWALGLGEGDSR